jgi:membrane-associated phospholipid phosphatase
MAHPSPIASPWPVRAVRILLMVVALAAWFTTQALLARRGAATRGIDDLLFALTAGPHAFLLSHPAWADGLLILSSAFIDLLGLFILLRTAFGPTLRPFLGLLILFALRQACQGLISLPLPEGMIWHHPGFPSLLVTYGTSSDLFFSGHTAIAVFGATELARLQRRWLTAAAVLIAVFESAAVIVLRAHYTMDVLTGIIAGLWVAAIVGRLAPPVDRALARLSGAPLRQPPA